MYNYGGYYDGMYELDPAYTEDLYDMYDKFAANRANKSKLKQRLANNLKTPKTDAYDDFWETDAMSRNDFTEAAKQATGAAADVVGDSVTDALTAKNGKGFLAGAKSNLGDVWKNLKSGKGAMPKFAKTANIIGGAMGALNAAKGISDYNTEMQNSNDIANDILASATGNPNLRYDLTADQLKMLRQLQNGTYDLSGNLDVSSILGNLGQTAIGAGTGYLTGGIPGAIIGGVSGLADGVLGGMKNDQQRISSELEGLYQSLYESELRNKQMQRNAHMQRYANSLY